MVGCKTPFSVGNNVQEQNKIQGYQHKSHNKPDPVPPLKTEIQEISRHNDCPEVIKECEWTGQDNRGLKGKTNEDGNKPKRIHYFEMIAGIIPLHRDTIQDDWYHLQQPRINAKTGIPAELGLIIECLIRQNPRQIIIISCHGGE